MTIKTDIDAAIEEETIKRRDGKRAKPDAALVLGGPAIRELERRIYQLKPESYRGFPIVETADFEGWELRC